jgi:hypothetical protein
MKTMLLDEATIMGVIIGLSTLFGNTGVPKKVIPYLNIVMGVGLNYMMNPVEGILPAVVAGLIAGIMAGNLYDFSQVKEG